MVKRNLLVGIRSKGNKELKEVPALFQLALYPDNLENWAIILNEEGRELSGCETKTKMLSLYYIIV